MHNDTFADAVRPPSPSGDREEVSRIPPNQIDHAQARELLRAARAGPLPPAEANALAAHLLECDACYRLAQDQAYAEHPGAR